MSREVAGRAARAAQPGGRAIALALVLAAAVLLAPSATPPTLPTTLPATPPATLPTTAVTSWLRADILPAADQPTGRDGDLGRVAVTVTLTNGLPTPIQLTDVTVLGLGTVLVDRGPSGVTTIGPTATVRLPGSVLADCTRRLDPAPVVQVLVSVIVSADSIIVAPAGTRPSARLQSVLDPVCPQTPSGLAVAITGSQPQADGSLLVRLVNTGRVFVSLVALAGPGAGGARLVPDPPLPASLGPGEAVLTRLQFVVPGCSVPDPVGQSRQLSLEARTPWGYTAVTGWPADSAARALRATARGCEQPGH